MGQLEDMALFVRIVDAGSITKAADQLDIAKSAVSRRLKDLETRLGIQLISRTTRQSHLTEAGVHYYQRANSILGEVDALNETTSGIKTQIEGTLKMTAPLSFGLLHLNEVINDYANQYPDLNFELKFSDRHIDLVEEGYELAIRIGELQDSSYQAKPLTTIRNVICASPEYLSRMGVPANLTDLADHKFLHYGLSAQNHIELIDSQGQTQTFSIPKNSKMKANNGDFLLDMAIRGHGITFAPTFIAYQALACGELIAILKDYKLPLFNAYAVYPQNRFLSQRCRLLIDFIAERFGNDPYWDQINLQ